MIPSGCHEYFSLLKQYFGWLFDEYGFVLLHAKNGRMSSCGFLLQSGDCRLYISFDRTRFGGIQIAMVPASEQSNVFIPGLHWYAVGEIIDYLRGAYLDWPQIEERVQLAADLSLEEALVERAEEARPFWPQTMDLFQKDEFKRRQEELEEFLRRKDEEQERQRKEWVRRREAEWRKNRE